MTIDDKIKDEKLQYDFNRKAAKISALLSCKIDKYEYVTGEETLPSDQSKIIEQVKFICSPLDKAFKKQTKTIEEPGQKQIKALEEHGKQLVKSSDEKESLTHSKQKEIFKGLANKRMEQLQDLSKLIDFNNLTHHYKNKNVPKKFIGFKGPLSFYRNIKEGYITVCSYHVTYAFQSESALYSCLNVKELLARNRHHI